MTKMRLVEILLVAVLVPTGALPACRGSKLPGFIVAGTPASWQPTSFASWVPAPMVRATWMGDKDIEDTEGHALLDTGSPVTVLRPGAPFPDGDLLGPRPCKLNTLGLLLEDPIVVAGDLLASRPDLVGVVGADILSRFCLALDYQANKAGLFDSRRCPPDPASPTAAWTSVDMALAGGGVLHMSDDSTVRVPATRLLVPIVIEGRSLVALLDTGASSVVLSPGLAADLLSSDNRRPVLSGLSVTTVDGPTSGWMTRAAFVATGEASLRSVPCLVVDSQPLFDGLNAETGADVQVLVGETFLRSFALAMNQRTLRLFLARYRHDSHLDPNEFVFVGLSLKNGDNGVEVASVYPDKDAARKGVEPGDILTAVDGQSPQDAADAAKRILSHGVGQTVALTLKHGTDEFTRDVLVENLLPDYPEAKHKRHISAVGKRGVRWWQMQHIGLVYIQRPIRRLGKERQP